MKKTIIKVVLILLIIIEGIYIILPNHKLNSKIEKVSYENNNINNKSTLAYYIDGEFQENRDTWPTDSLGIVLLRAECYYGDHTPVSADEVLEFDDKTHIATITTDKSVHCSLYFFLPAASIIDKNSSGKTLETEVELATRNETIAGNIKDDLRRFVGDYTTVTDNFICFGTDNMQTCKENMDLYMYRIIGIDAEGRLKIIKATKIFADSKSTFQWYSSLKANIKWNSSSLYSGLNGGYFTKNTKYNYMQDETWTKLISPATYYTGIRRGWVALTTAQHFEDERSSSFSNALIGAMYLTDFMYSSACDSDASECLTGVPWLALANGLNGEQNTPEGVANPSTFDTEWTMSRSAWDPNGTGDSYVYNVSGNGYRNHAVMTDWYSVRPVFYLTSEIKITDGNGGIDTPYIIT